MCIVKHSDHIEDDTEKSNTIGQSRMKLSLLLKAELSFANNYYYCIFLLLNRNMYLRIGSQQRWEERKNNPLSIQ